MAGVPSALKRQIEEFEAADSDKPVGVVVQRPQDGQVVHSGGVVDPVEQPGDESRSEKDTVDSALDNAPEPKKGFEPTVASKEPQDEDWKQKFLSLQGKFNASNSATAELKARLDAIEKNKAFLEERTPALSKENSELKAEIERLKAAVEAKSLGRIADELPDDVRENFAESLDVMESVAQKVAERRLSKVDEALKRLEQADKGRAEEAAVESKRRKIEESQRFYTETANKIAGSAEKFDELIKSIDFVAFMDSPVEGTGRKVNDFLMEAHDKRDSTGIDYWFSQFNKRLQPKTNAALPVVPGKTSGADIPVEKKVYTMADLELLHKQVRTKAISQEEFDKRLKIFDLAEKEGRFKE